MAMLSTEVQNAGAGAAASNCDAVVRTGSLLILMQLVLSSGADAKPTAACFIALLLVAS